MKKISSILLGVISVLVSLILVTSCKEGEDYSRNLKFYFNSDKKSTYVVGVDTTSIGIDTTKDTNIVIPSTHASLPVTRIGNSAFYGFNYVTSITIPNSVISIGDDAFSKCTSLENITIPDSVTSIGNSAFSGCTNLTHVIIGDGVTCIGENTFDDCCTLTKITIPNSVTSIGSSAFKGCSNLTNVYYEGSIEDWCKIQFNSSDSNPMLYAKHFYTINSKNEWEEVTSIEIPNTITKIGGYQFYGFNNVKNIKIQSNVASIGTSAFEDCSSLESVTIPDSVTTIGTSAFKDCSSLESVTIPNSVTTIGSSAFKDCNSLISIVIPPSVTSIGDNAFLGCHKLVEIYNLSPLIIVGGYTNNGCVAYYAKVIHFFLNVESSLMVKDDFLFIKDRTSNYFLVDYTGLETTIALPNDIEGNTYKINDYAFENSISVTSIVIPDSVTSIGHGAFYNCSSLARVTIGNGVTSIEAAAFKNCSSLTSIVIPNCVRYVGEGAFSYCVKLKSVKYGGTIKQWNSITIEQYGNDELKSANIHYGETSHDSTESSSENNSTTVSPTNDNQNKWNNCILKLLPYPKFGNCTSITASSQVGQYERTAGAVFSGATISDVRSYKDLLVSNGFSKMVNESTISGTYAFTAYNSGSTYKVSIGYSQGIFTVVLGEL